MEKSLIFRTGDGIIGKLRTGDGDQTPPLTPSSMPLLVTVRIHSGANLVKKWKYVIFDVNFQAISMKLCKMKLTNKRKLLVAMVTMWTKLVAMVTQ